MKSVADEGYSCQTQRSDSKKSRNRTRRLMCVSGGYGLSQESVGDAVARRLCLRRPCGSSRRGPSKV